MLTILQIDYFIELVKYMSFSKASEVLYISQPALSKQIGNLEKELGFQLFDRKGQSIELTPEGDKMYDYFVSCKDNYNKVINSIMASRDREVTQLEIAFLSGWNLSKIFSEINGILADKYPDISIHLESGDFDDLSDKLNSGSVDIVLSLPSNFDGVKNINLNHIANIDKYLVYSKSNPLSEREDLTLEDFKGENFFVFNNAEGRAKLEIMMELSDSLGFQPRVSNVSNIESMMLNVETGRGVAIFDEWHRIIDGDKVKKLNIGHSHKVYAGWKKENANPAIEVFVTKLMKILNK